MNTYMYIHTHIYRERERKVEGYQPRAAEEVLDGLLLGPPLDPRHRPTLGS